MGYKMGRRDEREYIRLNLWCAAKWRAGKYDIPFNIDLEDIALPLNCPVLGIPLFRTGQKMTDNSYTLDKIVPSKGYVKGNIRVISWRANRLKSDGCARELRLIADYIERETRSAEASLPLADVSTGQDMAHGDPSSSQG